ncbi:MAG: GspH/FimT family pseudopilin [Saezia sp.]
MRAIKNEKMLSRYSKKGFTLIELMIAVALVAILLTWAVPSFQEMTARRKIDAASTELFKAITSAKSRAFAEKRKIRIDCINIGEGWVGGWTVVDADTNQVLDNYSPKKGVGIVQAGSAVPCGVVIDGIGYGAAFGSFNITSTNTTYSRRIALAADGTLKLTTNP